MAGIDAICNHDTPAFYHYCEQTEITIYGRHAIGVLLSTIQNLGHFKQVELQKEMKEEWSRRRIFNHYLKFIFGKDLYLRTMYKCQLTSYNTTSSFLLNPNALYRQLARSEKLTEVNNAAIYSASVDTTCHTNLLAYDQSEKVVDPEKDSVSYASLITVQVQDQEEVS